jgi:AraC-like DNA-binding protein
VFCTIEDNIKHTFGKGENNIYFKVFLPYSYINSKAEQYPDVFGTLSEMIKNQCPVLKDGNLTTTLEMKTVIEQIKNAPDMGTLAPFYFETKIQELLILQLQQMRKFSCPECKYYKHYREQLNEARNLLETRYQTPPTIAQLAQEVGMSETVLKTNFKNCFGTTIYGYLFEYRMNIAKKLLSDSTLTIAEIGDQTGYEHPSHFTTAFKRKFGLSPVEYRGRA